MRFKKDILDTSLAKLSNEQEKFETLKDNVVEQISELPLSINVVANEETLIKISQTNNFWAKITDDDLDELADKLSELMKFRHSSDSLAGPAKFDFKDILKNKEMIEFGPEHEATSISKYKEMVEKLILELTDSNPILHKIKDGVEVTDAEASELAELLYNEHPHITEDLLRNVYNNRKAKLIQFIKHILGIEILEYFSSTVEKAFEQFIQEHSNFNSRQLTFLNLLKDFILERESLQKRDLIESPFTIIHPKGIRGVFSPAEIKEILKFTEDLVA